MIPQKPWFERKFSFDFPLGLYPVIIERMRGALPRILRLIEGLEAPQLRQRFDNRWSIQEQIGHLYDLDALHNGRIDDYLAGARTLRPADVTNYQTTAAEHNNRRIADTIGDFLQRRSALIERFEGLDDGIIARVAIHPRLNQPMRLIDMAYFTAEHDDHHIAVMRSIRRRLEESQ